MEKKVKQKKTFLNRNKDSVKNTREADIRLKLGRHFVCYSEILVSYDEARAINY